MASVLNFVDIVRKLFGFGIVFGLIDITADASTDITTGLSAITWCAAGMNIKGAGGIGDGVVCIPHATAGLITVEPVGAAGAGTYWYLAIGARPG